MSDLEFAKDRIMMGAERKSAVGEREGERERKKERERESARVRARAPRNSAPHTLHPRPPSPPHTPSLLSAAYLTLRRRGSHGESRLTKTL